MRLIHCLTLCGLLVLGGCVRPTPPAQHDAPKSEPGNVRAQFPPDKHGELVYQGYQIFTQTPKAARIYAGNDLNCSNCHLDAGRKANAAPLWGAFGMYPAYSAKSDRVVTLAERIQQCFTFSMNGLPPPLDSHEMAALLAYAQYVSRGRPVGVEQEGRGFPTVERTGTDPNPLLGKALYAGRCAACHGEHGEGRKSGDDSFAVPPLWGMHSFNKGAGMNRIDLLAGFLKANMPLGNANLTDQEALDLAAWVHLQERWPDPRKGLISGFLEK
jgi:thiosulfate dehydrogenase